MINELFLLMVAASTLILLGMGIWAKQKRAKSCSRHQRWAGIIAVFLAIACLIIGITLLAFMIFVTI